MFPESTRAETQRSFSRRWFMKDCGLGEAHAAAPVISPQAPKPPPFPAKAKNVIFLFMGGAPSHLDLFDRKPELIRMDGKTPPAELLKGYRSA
jgi:hypothetical protein